MPPIRNPYRNRARSRPIGAQTNTRGSAGPADALRHNISIPKSWTRQVRLSPRDRRIIRRDVTDWRLAEQFVCARWNLIPHDFHYWEPTDAHRIVNGKREEFDIKFTSIRDNGKYEIKASHHQLMYMMRNNGKFMIVDRRTPTVAVVSASKVHDLFSG